MDSYAIVQQMMCNNKDISSQMGGALKLNLNTDGAQWSNVFSC